jgi:FkbM family methyltransferase
MKSGRLVRVLEWARVLGWATTFRNLLAISLGRRCRLLSVRGIAGKIRVRANDSDLVMFEQVFVNRDYGFDLSFEPSTIIDAGANAGYASLFFHRKYPKARLIAIEPDSENWETLRVNTGEIPQIQAVKGGLWSSQQPLAVTDADAPKCMISLKPAGKSGPDTIEGYGVEDIMKMLGVEVIDLLKIDIEGGELELFSENCLPWITKVRVFMVELHDRLRPGCAAAFYSAIRDLRFTQHQEGDIVMIINEDLQPK